MFDLGSLFDMYAPRSDALAYQAGKSGEYIQCDTKRDLAAWFMGVAAHCKTMRPATESDAP